MRTVCQLLILLLFSFCLLNCKGKKTKLAATDAVTMDDFIEFFPDITLPFQLTDSLLNKKETDSAVIEYNVFTQFVPDSVIAAQFGKQKPTIYALGKVSLKKAETYMFLKAVTAAHKTGMILAFDKDQKFLAGLPLLATGKNPMPYQKAGMDKKYTVTQTFVQNAEDGSPYEARNAYFLNSEAHNFTKIMTDEGNTNEVHEIINPIDTFSHTGKFAGDYIKDNRNFVSVRDGRDPSMVLFFVHFEKNGGDCIGELKGEAVINGPKTAVYKATGNPCVLALTFNGNHVALKEDEACGSYRDIKCFFEGTYSKKADPQPKKKKKTRART